MNRALWIAAAAAGLAACQPSQVRLEGRMIGCSRQTIRLEAALPSTGALSDTTTTDEKGNFRFRLPLEKGQPALYNLVCNGERIPLLLSPGERVRVHSVGTLSRNYTVEGSPESEFVAQVNALMTDGVARLDSIAEVYARPGLSEEVRRSVLHEYTRAYYGVKRAQIAFIVTHPQALAAIYALYQRLPGDPVLFNGDNDVVYYRMVADSVARRYPHSNYLATLRRDVERMDQIARIPITESEYPDLDLPDMFGKRIRLSTLKGQVILLDFWSAAAPVCNANNASLKELYKHYADRGLAVYQVGADESKAQWVTAVQEQNLPWITVCDFRGTQSPALGVYNVQRIPSNILIDRQGRIAGRDLYGPALEKRLNELL